MTTACLQLSSRSPLCCSQLPCPQPPSTKPLTGGADKTPPLWDARKVLQGLQSFHTSVFLPEHFASLFVVLEKEKVSCFQWKKEKRHKNVSQIFSLLFVGIPVTLVKDCFYLVSHHKQTIELTLLLQLKSITHFKIFFFNPSVTYSRD